MKHAFILSLFLLVGVKVFAITDRIRIGLFASPGIAWAKPFGKDLTSGKPRFGADYGFMIEYWFAKNYGLATGVSGMYDGGNIGGRDLFQVKDSAGTVLRTVNEKYAFHYVALPIYLKLKTNDIKGSNFQVWGQLGFNLNFTVSARATYDNPIPTGGGDLSIEKENIMRKANDVTQVIPGFKSNFFDVRLGAGGGFEYNFDDNASLLVGLFYHNGFLNNIQDKDTKKDPILMRFMSLRVGVLF